MLKKTISYTDYDGNKRTEDFYFNLSKAELVEMNLSIDGGFDKYLRKIIASENVPEIGKVFKDIIRRSYGEKSADGRRFIKSDELTEGFLQTEAYSELYMELIGNAESASHFMNSIIPADVANADNRTLASAI